MEKLLDRTDLKRLEDIVLYYVEKMRYKQTRFSTSFNSQFYKEEEDKGRALLNRLRECLGTLEAERIKSESVCDLVDYR